MSEKEVVVLNSIAKKNSSSQRELARLTGISLGLINGILKKFIRSGYIKVSQLNKRKMEYLLTPEGLSQAVSLSHQSASDTIRSYKTLQSQLGDLLLGLHTAGYNYFSIHGDGELRELVETAFLRYLEEAPVTLGRDHKEHSCAVVLNVTPDLQTQWIKGDVVHVLQKIGV